MKPLGSGLSGASPIATSGGFRSFNLFFNIYSADALSAPLTKPHKILFLVSSLKIFFSIRIFSFFINPVQISDSRGDFKPKYKFSKWQTNSFLVGGEIVNLLLTMCLFT